MLVRSFLLMLSAIQLATVVRADEPLPRVLILGDTIYNQPARSAATELKGRVEVVFPKDRPGDTATALTRLDELLGDGTWDVIHFNFGLADLHYKDPRTKTVRAMSKHAGAVRVTSPEQYEQNLQRLVANLKATNAKLIWASTTPIETSRYDGIFDPGSEIEYNEIAARVMAKHKVSINDMHAFVLANVKNKRDPFWFDRVPLHPPIVESLLSALDLPTRVNDKND